MPDLTNSSNIHQSTASLATLNVNQTNNSTTSNLTPTPSINILPQLQPAPSQSQLTASLPNSLQTSNPLLLSTTNINASTSTLSSTSTVTHSLMNSNNNNILSTSLTSNELNARFDMWTECLAELLVYKNILKCPLTRIEAWRMVFFRLTQLFTSVDPR